MTTMFSKEIKEIRNPFKIDRLPIMARLCRCWFDNIQQKKTKQKAKFARAWFVYFYKLGIQSTGMVEFERQGNKYQIKFDARNTQFSALYLKRYDVGYECELAVLLDLIVPDKGVFFDVGANFGYFTLYVASRPGFAGKIYSFEPHPDSYRDLTHMIDQSGLKDVVRPFCLAAYLKEDIMFVKPSGVRSGNFSLDDRSKNQNNHKIKLARLDSLDCKYPDVLKIDTDGSESEVLEGCSKFFTKGRPHVVFESVLYHNNPRKTMEPFIFLAQHGYVFFYIGWLQNIGGENDTCIIKNEEEIENNKKNVLGLSLFEYEQRFLFAERLNIFAISKERLIELESIFRKGSAGCIPTKNLDRLDLHEAR